MAEIVCMLMIAGLVFMIVAELVNRNFFGKSFRATIEICGIEFLWMAFIGLIPLYCNSGLMRLEFLVSRAHGKTAQILYFANKVFSLMLGVVMVIAFVAQYPYVPMAISGAYIAVKSLEQIVDRALHLTRGQDTEG